MLDLKRVLAAKPKEHQDAQLQHLFTPWGETIDPNNVLHEHPNPLFARHSFRTLNGWWDCAFDKAIQNPHEFEMKGNRHDDAGAPPNLTGLVRQVQTALPPREDRFDRQILVPFSPEAPLSGINRQLQPNELLWYRRTFETPALLSGHRLLLHFQAVDHTCAVYLNGQLLGLHAGGYHHFAFDVTDYLMPETNVLMLCVADASEKAHQVRGKQRLDRGDIWYTAQSGIWQSVWMETVPLNHIAQIEISTSAEAGAIRIQANLHRKDPERLPHTLKFEIINPDDQVVAHADFPVEGDACAAEFTLAEPQLWSPDNPYLYRILLTYGADVVESYCGIRTVEVRCDAKGVARLHLNGRPLFVKGVLDQGYWSDGLMTAPSDEALAFDIKAARAAGFNLIRKHIKVEQLRWYYHCDRLGMLVWQDMVNGGDEDLHSWQFSYKPTLFKRSWGNYDDTNPAHLKALGADDEAYRQEWLASCQQTMARLAGHPSIVAWGLFNEGWGQFNSTEACQRVQAFDPTRPVDAVSGWYDQGAGDFFSVHNYFRDLAVWPDKKAGAGKRAFVISECGGLNFHVAGHSSLDKSYGYDSYEDLAAWQAAVRELLAHLDALEGEGLAGYIYTQLSDIEEETNGLLTYDRRVHKLLAGTKPAEPSAAESKTPAKIPSQIASKANQEH